MKPEWRKVLERRSVRDKIAIAIDCDIAETDSINAVAELVREGYMVWIDRSALPMVVISKASGKSRYGVNSDIYLLTPKGVELCDANGIERH